LQSCSSVSTALSRTPARAEGTEAPDIRGAATAFTDYLSLTGAAVASAVLSIFSVLVTTRILDPSGYALLAYLTIAGTLLVTVSAYWTAAAVLRFGREELEAEGTMTAVTWSRLSIVAPLFVLATGVLVGLALANLLPHGFSAALTAVAVLYGLVLLVGEHMTYTLQAVDEIKRSALGWVVRHAAVVAVLILILATGRGASPVVIAAANVVASAVVALWLAYTVWDVALWPMSVDGDVRRRILAFSIPLIAFTVSQYAIASVDLVVIGAFSGRHDAGIYAVAYQGYSVLQQVAVGCVPVILPLLVSIRMAQREQLVRRYFERVMPQLLFIGSVVGGVAVAPVPLLFPVVLGGAFADASQPLVILIAALLLYFAASLLAPVMMLNELTRAVGAISVLSAAVNVAGDIVLIGVFDLAIWAAAASTSAAVAVVWIGYLLVSRRVLASNAVPNPLLFTPFLAGFISALVLPSGAALAAGVVGAVTTGAVVLRLLPLFGTSDLETIERLQMWAPMRRVAMRLVEFGGR
jgi:O-antigen/teichoic acid export membrane protein